MFFLDTNVFLYSIGKEHPHKEPCRRLIDAVAEERVEANTSAEVLQEVLHVLNRRGQRKTGARLVYDLLGLFPDVLPVRAIEISAATHILRDHPWLPVRDAVHGATMKIHGLRRIVTADRHFDDVPEIEWIKPGDWETVG